MAIVAFGLATLLQSDVFQPSARASATRSSVLPWHLVFVNNRDGDKDVYAVGASGGRIAALTRNKANEDVEALSSDGRWLLVDRDALGGALVSGNGRREITKVDTPGVFAPDGQTVATTRWLHPPWDYERARIVLFTPGTGRTRDLGNGVPLVFSPNGRLLAYFDRMNGSLGVVDVGSGRRWRVAGAAQSSDRVSWSPSGKRLAWTYLHPDESAKNKVYVADAATPGARPRAILTGSPDWTWLPGDRLGVGVYRDSVGDTPASTEVRVLDAHGRTLGPVRHTVVTSLAWSPDGRRIAYHRTAATGGHHELVVLNLATGRSHVLLETGDGGLGWSPTGARLAAGVGGGVIVIDVATWATVELDKTHGGLEFKWTPDGSALAWSSASGIRLAAVAAGGTHTVPISAETRIAGWAPGPLPSDALTAVPPPPPEVVASPSELHTAGAIAEIAADGAYAAVILRPSLTDCTHVVAWAPGTSSVVRFNQPGPCYSRDDEPYEYRLALKGHIVSWSGISHGNSLYRTDCHANVLTAGRIWCGDEYDIWDPENDVDDEGNPLPNPEPDLSHPPPPAETHRGVSFAVDHGAVVLQRLADGRTRTLRPPGGAVDAELEDTGLYYAYVLHTASDGRPGRVVFVPFAKLFS